MLNHFIQNKYCYIRRCVFNYSFKSAEQSSTGVNLRDASYGTDSCIESVATGYIYNVMHIFSVYKMGDRTIWQEFIFCC